MPPFLRVATLAHFDFQAVDERERIGAGKGLTDADATASAIGEAVERYCAYQWDETRTHVGRAGRSVAEAAIRPTDLVLYPAERYAEPGMALHVVGRDDGDVVDRGGGPPEWSIHRRAGEPRLPGAPAGTIGGPLHLADVERPGRRGVDRPRPARGAVRGHGA